MVLARASASRERCGRIRRTTVRRSWGVARALSCKQQRRQMQEHRIGASVGDAWVLAVVCIDRAITCIQVLTGACMNIFSIACAITCINPNAGKSTCIHCSQHYLYSWKLMRQYLYHLSFLVVKSTCLHSSCTMILDMLMISLMSCVCLDSLQKQTSRLWL